MRLTGSTLIVVVSLVSAAVGGIGGWALGQRGGRTTADSVTIRQSVAVKTRATLFGLPARPGKEHAKDPPASGTGISRLENVARAIKRQDQFSEYVELLQAVRELDPPEYPAALERLTHLPPNSFGSVEIPLVQRWAEIDAAAAVQYLDQNKKDFDWLRSTAYRAWAMKDPKAASEHAKQYASRVERRRAFTTVAEGWCLLDRPSALTWALKIDDLELRQDATVQVLKTWSAQNPRQAFDYALHMKSPRIQPWVLANLIPTRSGNPQVALDLVEQMPDSPQKLAIKLQIARNLANTDPASAASYAMSLPTGRYQSEAISSVASEWAREDLTAALEWVSKLHKGEAQESALAQVLSHWAKEDPLAAAEYTISKVAPEQMSSALTSVSKYWADSDPRQALDWSATLDSETRQRFQGSIFTWWSSEDPAAVAEYIARVGDGELQRREAISIAGQFASTDPESAARWVERLSDEQAREVAATQVSRRWAQIDAYAASEWLSKMEAGPTRDGAISGFTSELAEIEPEGAANWAATISDESKRTASIVGVVLEWKEINLQAARDWLTKSAAVNPEQKAELLQILSK
jgi:hypothetical protein